MVWAENIWWAHHIDVSLDKSPPPTYLGGQILLLTHFQSLNFEDKQHTQFGENLRTNCTTYISLLLLYSSKVLVVVVVFLSLSLCLSEGFLKYTFMRYFHQIYCSMVICTAVSFFVEIGKKIYEPFCNFLNTQAPFMRYFHQTTICMRYVTAVSFFVEI